MEDLLPTPQIPTETTSETPKHLRTTTQFSPEEKAVIAEKYKNGGKGTDIQKEHGIKNAASFYLILKEQGVSARKQFKKTDKKDDNQPTIPRFSLKVSGIKVSLFAPDTVAVENIEVDNQDINFYIK